MKKIVLLLLLLISSSIFAQKKINNYQYIIVDRQFDFVKKPDKYQTSSLTKFLFNKEGFVTYLEDENIPEEVRLNRCLYLKANVLDYSNLLTTKVKVELRDCYNTVVFLSAEGTSRIKDFKKAYHEAIRAAFVSVKALNYSYKNPSSEGKRIPTATKKIDARNDVAKEKTIFNNRPNKKGNKRNNNTTNASQNNPFQSNRIPVLQAKRNGTGFQLINVKGKVVFDVLTTQLKEVFVIKSKNGILYKENNNWIAEYYNLNGNKVIKEFDVRMGSN